MIKWLRHVCVVSAVGALALGYGLREQVVPIIIVVLYGLLWLFGQWRGWLWTAGLGLPLHMLAALGGLWFQVPAGGILFAAIATLAAWDLDYFARRVQSQNKTRAWSPTSLHQPHSSDKGRQRNPSPASVDSTHQRRLAWHHLRRLLIVLGLSGALGTVALVIRTPVGFGWAMLLGLAAFLGLSQIVNTLRRESS
jgi:hypothetical protein